MVNSVLAGISECVDINSLGKYSVKPFDLNTELGKKIKSKRMRPWRWSTSVSCVPQKQIHSFAPIQKPSLGDLALVQVLTVGAHTLIEEATGSRLSIFPGTVFVGAFSNRYAPDEYEGIVPEVLDASLEVDLISIGGTLGQVESKNSQTAEPTRCRVLSFLSDKDGRVANTQNFGLAPPPSRKKVNPRLIIVTGTSMNSGKSNSAKAIIYALTAAGETVVAGKVTGTAAKKDVLLMKTAGAIDVCDFVDFGYPSTYMLKKKEILDLFWNLYDYLSSRSETDGYIVLEIADGILQQEVEFLLGDPDVQAAASHFVFSCSDSISAISGVEYLKKTFGIEVSAISGPCANSPLNLREVRRFLTELPAFNNMEINVATIAQIFTSAKIQTQEKIEARAEDVELQPENVPPEL